MEAQNHHEEAVEGDDDDMPIPLNSAYTHHHHHHMIHDPPISSSTIDDHPFKKAIRYRECLKNHAASMGGTATDGCGEFMASGDEGTLEALTCSVCNCHRNFHRKEVEGEDMNNNNNNNNNNNCINPRRNPLFLTHHNHNSYHRHPGGALIPSRPIPHHQMLMSYTGIGAASESDEQEDHLHHHHHQGNGMNIMRSQLPHQNMVKKRFRTKFTQEQKEKMLNFAEKVGWKIQKQEESVVQQFCQEVGVKRRVLKVWMHNNKHNLAKKNLQTNVNPPQEQL